MDIVIPAFRLRLTPRWWLRILVAPAIGMLVTRGVVSADRVAVSTIGTFLIRRGFRHEIVA